MKILTKKLRLAFGLIATQIDEITVRSAETGWSIKAIDPSKTSMMFAEIPATAFIEYERTEDFTVSLKNINKAIANAGEELQITVADGSMVIRSERIRSKFPLLMVPEADQRMPNLQYATRLTLPVSEIARMMTAVYGQVDSYTFDLKNEVLTISAEDQSGNGATMEITKDQCLAIDGGEAHAVYNIEFLDKMLKAMPKEAVIDIGLATNYPLEITLQDDTLKLIYILAPWIDNGE